MPGTCAVRPSVEAVRLPILFKLVVGAAVEWYSGIDWRLLVVAAVCLCQHEDNAETHIVMNVLEKLDMMIAGLRNFTETLWSQTCTVFDDNQDLVLDENRWQMEESKMPSGENIRPEYGNVYAAYKGFFEPNLRDSGAFHASLTVAHDDSHIWVTSTDPKWDSPIPATWLPHKEGDQSLHERYGEVLGVSAEFVSSTMVPLVLDTFIMNLRYALQNGVIYRG